MDEQGRRLSAAAEVRAVDHGGLAAVVRATGLSRATIGRGLTNLDRAPLPVAECGATAAAGTR